MEAATVRESHKVSDTYHGNGNEAPEARPQVSPVRGRGAQRALRAKCWVNERNITFLAAAGPSRNDSVATNDIFLPHPCKPKSMPARHFKFNVFLSHNRAQKDWTRDLAIRLRDAGFNVWFDEWALRGGEVGSRTASPTL
jgi:hypothetical protein